MNSRATSYSSLPTYGSKFAGPASKPTSYGSSSKTARDRPGSGYTSDYNRSGYVSGSGYTSDYGRGGGYVSGGGYNSDYNNRSGYVSGSGYTSDYNRSGYASGAGYKPPGEYGRSNSYTPSPSFGTDYNRRGSAATYNPGSMYAGSSYKSSRPSEPSSPTKAYGGSSGIVSSRLNTYSSRPSYSRSVSREEATPSYSRSTSRDSSYSSRTYVPSYRSQPAYSRSTSREDPATANSSYSSRGNNNNTNHNANNGNHRSSGSPKNKPNKNKVPADFTSDSTSGDDASPNEDVACVYLISRGTSPTQKRSTNDKSNNGVASTTKKRIPQNKKTNVKVVHTSQQTGEEPKIPDPPKPRTYGSPSTPAAPRSTSSYQTYSRTPSAKLQQTNEEKSSKPPAVNGTVTNLVKSSTGVNSNTSKDLNVGTPATKQASQNTTKSVIPDDSDKKKDYRKSTLNMGLEVPNVGEIRDQEKRLSRENSPCIKRTHSRGKMDEKRLSATRDSDGDKKLPRNLSRGKIDQDEQGIRRTHSRSKMNNNNKGSHDDTDSSSDDSEGNKSPRNRNRRPVRRNKSREDLLDPGDTSPRGPKRTTSSKELADDRPPRPQSANLDNDRNAKSGKVSPLQTRANLSDDKKASTFRSNSRDNVPVESKVSANKPGLPVSPTKPNPIQVKVIPTLTPTCTTSPPTTAKSPSKKVSEESEESSEETESESESEEEAAKDAPKAGDKSNNLPKLTLTIPPPPAPVNKTPTPPSSKTEPDQITAPNKPAASLGWRDAAQLKKAAGPLNKSSTTLGPKSTPPTTNDPKLDKPNEIAASDKDAAKTNNSTQHSKSGLNLANNKGQKLSTSKSCAQVPAKVSPANKGLASSASSHSLAKNVKKNPDSKFIGQVKDIDSLLNNDGESGSFEDFEEKFDKASKAPDDQTKQKARDQLSTFIGKCRDIDEMLGLPPPISPNMSEIRKPFEFARSETVIMRSTGQGKMEMNHDTVSDSSEETEESSDEDDEAGTKKGSPASEGSGSLEEIDVAKVKVHEGKSAQRPQLSTYTEEIDKSAVRVCENKAMAPTIRKLTEGIGSTGIGKKLLGKTNKSQLPDKVRKL